MQSLMLFETALIRKSLFALVAGEGFVPLVSPHMRLPRVFVEEGLRAELTFPGPLA